jgi:hypothetical protein
MTTVAPTTGFPVAASSAVTETLKLSPTKDGSGASLTNILKTGAALTFEAGERRNKPAPTESIKKTERILCFFMALNQITVTRNV